MKTLIRSRRLFLALWPDATACQQLQVLDVHGGWPSAAVRYQPADWHVTLHYLGAVLETHLPVLLPALAQPFEPFCLTLTQVQAWPRGLQVLCPDVIPQPLALLRQQLAEVLPQQGLPVDVRPYRPHLTLARHAEEARLPDRVPPVSWAVSSYLLVESTGDRQKRYRPLARYTAAGGWQVVEPGGAPEGAP